MFNKVRICAKCPFRSDKNGIRLSPDRVNEIVNAPAFQCHKTVDYSNYEDECARQGDNPQQCAGLMVLLHKEGKPNQIMQVAQRLTGFDAGKIDPTGSFDSIEECLKAHAESHKTY